MDIITHLMALSLTLSYALGPGAPQGPVACMNQAMSMGLLSQQEAYTLCEGSSGSSPFECYARASRALIPSKTALQLCRCTLSATRVDCYLQAKNSTSLTEEQILDLCEHDGNEVPGCSANRLIPG